MKKYTREQIEVMNGSALVAVYNDLTGEKVKRFPDRASGLRRVLAALGEPAAPAAPAPAPAPHNEKAPSKRAKAQGKVAPAPAAPVVEQAAEAPATGKRGKPAARAFTAHPGGKAPRPDSKRGQLLAALRLPAGLTSEEICQRFDWKANDAKDALYLLARKNGVGVSCDDAGRWHAA